MIDEVRTEKEDKAGGRSCRRPPEADGIRYGDLKYVLANLPATPRRPTAAPGVDIGLQPPGQAAITGRGIDVGDYWTVFDRLGLQHYDQYGNAIPVVPGDANRDGYVDATDAQILAGHWGQPGEWQTGDFNNDDVVDAADAAILAANWAPRPAESTAVPEPSTIVLILGLMLTRRPNW